MEFFDRNRNILMLAPHTDDVELGCGGTLARLIEEDYKIHVAAFSSASESIPGGFPLDSLRKEFKAACLSFGLSETNIHLYDYPVRKLNFHRQEVLEDLMQLKSKLNHSVIFVPATTDLHQDHEVMAAEGVRAFKERTVLGYELPWNHIDFSANAFVVLKEHHIEAKWRALQYYETQLYLNRPYFQRDFVRGLATVRGSQIKMQFAEAFQVLRVCIT